MSAKHIQSKMILLCAVQIALFAVSASASIEYVTVIKVLEDDDKGIIERRNGERWLIEKGVGAISFWRFEGKQVLIHSPGLFCGVGSKLILPDLGQEAHIWDAERISGASRAANPIDTVDTSVITINALSELGYYDPESQEKNKSDPTLALKSFQAKSEVEASGKICFDTLLALSKGVSGISPVTEDSLELARLLLNAAEKMIAAQRIQPKAGATSNLPATVVESRLVGDFEGWEGDTVVTLLNGQVWQQVEFYYHYHYAFMPNAVVFQSNGIYKMLVDGVPKAVAVVRLR